MAGYGIFHEAILSQCLVQKSRVRPQISDRAVLERVSTTSPRRFGTAIKSLRSYSVSLTNSRGWLDFAFRAPEAIVTTNFSREITMLLGALYWIKL
jgi:hypothetical protein